jgi:DNA replicative helicase MCM subunit Mcm2 (Cdc46/Mcm family)
MLRFVLLCCSSICSLWFFVVRCSLLLLFVVVLECSRHFSVPIRGDLHVLVVGDPGLGKSQMLKACCACAPRSVYVTGGTTTATGLVSPSLFNRRFSRCSIVVSVVVQLLFNCCSIVVQLLFNCCSIVVQSLFNRCSIVVQSLFQSSFQSLFNCCSIVVQSLFNRRFSRCSVIYSTIVQPLFICTCLNRFPLLF